jgi:hypothetical protein
MNAYHHNAARGDEVVRDSRSCPYPHQAPNGATSHPAQTENFIAAFDAIDTVCSNPQCAQPVQFCQSCGASNRSLAKFCRACRQPLAFEDAILKFQATHEIEASKMIKEFRQVELPHVQGRPVSALATGWGYTLAAATGWGIGILANTRLQPPSWLSYFKIGSTEPIATFRALRHEDVPPGFLAIGTHTIYRIGFLPERRCKALFRLPDSTWMITGTILAGTLLVVRIWHRQSGWHRWLLIDCKDERQGVAVSTARRAERYDPYGRARQTVVSHEKRSRANRCYRGQRAAPARAGLRAERQSTAATFRTHGRSLSVRPGRRALSVQSC